MAADPRVWILSGGRKGDLDQMQALVAAAGWSCELKELRFRGLRHPLTARLETPLGPPWPDLAICAEALTSMVARRIKKSSSGTTRIVCLGRPAGAASDFDLVITTAQYRIQTATNVLQLSTPITNAEATSTPVPAVGPVVLLVGGPAFPDRMDAAIARRMAVDAMAHAAARNRKLRVLTSPRTPPEIVNTLQQIIVSSHRLDVFGTVENRYRAALTEAAEIVVTSDSVSMLADALAAARPVSVYPLPQAAGLKWQAGNWLYRHSVETPRIIFRPITYLFERAFIEPPADRQRLLERLVAERRLSWFGGSPVPPDPGAARRDLDLAVSRLRKLVN